MLAALPIDVQALLGRVENESPDLLSDSIFRLRIAFVPAAIASGNAADAVAHFVKPGEVPPQLEEALNQVVVISKTLVDKCRHGGRAATKAIAAAIPFRLTEADHKRVGQALQVRSAEGKPERTLKPEYAKYVEAAKIYTYSDGWIDLVVEELSDADRYEALVGHPPTPK